MSFGSDLRNLIVKIDFEVSNKSKSRLDMMFVNLHKTAAGLQRAISKVGKGLTSLGTLGARLEKTKAQFGVVFGSVEKGAEMMGKLNKLAVETPFLLQDIRKQAVMLTAMGLGDDLINNLKVLGDVAAALPNATLERVALNYGQVKAQGYLTGKEYRDFAVAGVDVFEELRRMTGKTSAQLRDMMRKRKLDFEMVKQAFKNMTSEGGRFNGMMEAIANTTGGMWNNMLVAMHLTFEKAGLMISDSFKPIFKFVKEFFLQNTNMIIDRLSVVTDAVKHIAEELETFLKDPVRLRKTLDSIILGLFFVMKLIGFILWLVVGIVEMIGNASDFSSIESSLKALRNMVILFFGMLMYKSNLFFNLVIGGIGKLILKLAVFSGDVSNVYKLLIGNNSTILFQFRTMGTLAKGMVRHLWKMVAPIVSSVAWFLTLVIIAFVVFFALVMLWDFLETMWAVLTGDLEGIDSVTKDWLLTLGGVEESWDRIKSYMVGVATLAAGLLTANPELIMAAITDFQRAGRAYNKNWTFEKNNLIDESGLERNGLPAKGSPGWDTMINELRSGNFDYNPNETEDSIDEELAIEADLEAEIATTFNKRKDPLPASGKPGTTINVWGDVHVEKTMDLIEPGIIAGH